VKYWLHGAHLLVEGKKMSKSLGNFFTLRDLLAKGFTGREIRYLLLTAHYRETFNFTIEGLQGARTALRRIEECLIKLVELLDPIVSDIRVEPDATVVSNYEAALDDDLNVSKAWGVIFGWIRDLNRSIATAGVSAHQAAVAIGTWKHLDTVMGLDLSPKLPMRLNEIKGVVSQGSLFKVTGEEDAPDEIKDLFRQRALARTAKDFKRSDEIRDELKARGWVVEDSPKGPKLKKL